jgi:4a-hydroxytetrahydrobiopterin dehydratase
MVRLTDADVTKELGALPGWAREGHAITRVFVFGGFPDAVAFVARLVPGAEAADHHPDVTISHRRVTVVFSTYSEGGLTRLDIEGAHLADGQAGLSP